MIIHGIDAVLSLAEALTVKTHDPAATIGEVRDMPVEHRNNRLQMMTDPEYYN